MNKMLIVVPYRNREDNLKEFIPYIKSTLHSQHIDNKIIIVEQDPDKLFNRGMLCNIGYIEYNNNFTHTCFHDVDIIGEDFDYNYEKFVTHLSAKSKSNNYSEFYKKCLGGVVIFPNSDFTKINGFSNEYWGWGAEDDDLRLRCDTMKIDIIRKQCKFYTLPHETIQWKNRPKHSPGYTENISRLNGFRQSVNKLNIITNDGLSNLSNKYTVLERLDYNEYIKMKVKV